jgi:hypothetical protein
MGGMGGQALERISHGSCPLANPRRAGRSTREGDEGKLKTGGLEPRATALTGDLSTTIPGTNLERLAYFGGIWDHSDSIKVTVEREADGASFDTSTWAVGGDAASLAEAREAFRDCLHGKWSRNLRKTGEARMVEAGLRRPVGKKRLINWSWSVSARPPVKFQQASFRCWPELFPSCSER